MLGQGNLQTRLEISPSLSYFHFVVSLSAALIAFLLLVRVAHYQICLLRYLLFPLFSNILFPDIYIVSMDKISSDCTSDWYDSTCYVILWNISVVTLLTWYLGGVYPVSWPGWLSPSPWRSCSGPQGRLGWSPHLPGPSSDTASSPGPARSHLNTNNQINTNTFSGIWSSNCLPKRNFEKGKFVIIAFYKLR